MGTTQALLDALALTKALRIEARLETALASYWRERRKRTAYYRLASRVLTPVFQSDGNIMGRLRDLFAGPIGRIPYVRRQAVLTLAGVKTGIWGADAAPLAASMDAAAAVCA
jgi:2-polyprenyl-6-methoxyphenol hydroxylase-like FAD-dependent oxidoreductase